MAIYIMRDCTEVQREKLNPVALSSRTPLNHILELTDPPMGTDVHALHSAGGSEAPAA